MSEALSKTLDGFLLARSSLVGARTYARDVRVIEELRRTIEQLGREGGGVAELPTPEVEPWVRVKGPITDLDVELARLATGAVVDRHPMKRCPGNHDSRLDAATVLRQLDRWLCRPPISGINAILLGAAVSSGGASGWYEDDQAFPPPGRTPALRLVR